MQIDPKRLLRELGITPVRHPRPDEALTMSDGSP